MTPAANTQENSPADRVAPYKWKPGQSGNPNGRPRKLRLLSDIADTHSEAALLKVVELMNSTDERIALVAAQTILDRVMGKPKQSVETTHKREASDYSRAELLAIARMGREGVDTPGHGSGQSDRILTLHAEELPPGPASRDDC